MLPECINFQFFVFHNSNFFRRIRWSGLHLTSNLENQVPIFMSQSDRVAQLYPQAPGSLLIIIFNSQGYVGGILTCLHTRSFMGIQNLVRMLCSISPVTESQIFLKSINSRFTSIFSSSAWQMQNIWSLVQVLHQNSHWWSPIISSTCEINFERRMLDKILCIQWNAYLRFVWEKGIL
jgi:hypothetical protein